MLRGTAKEGVLVIVQPSCLCRAFFDHSMHSALPLGIYLATKFWMYATWFYWFWNDILFSSKGFHEQIKIYSQKAQAYDGVK